MAYLCRDRVRVLEGACLVRYVTLYDTDNLPRVNLDVWLADAVSDMGYHDWLAAWRVERLVDIVQETCLRVVERVELNDDLVSAARHSGRYAACCCEVSLADSLALLDGRALQYSPVYLAVESVAYLLCHVAEVEVGIVYLACIDMLAEVRVCGVGGAEPYRLCVGEDTVGALSC